MRTEATLTERQPRTRTSNRPSTADPTPLFMGGGAAAPDAVAQTLGVLDFLCICDKAPISSAASRSRRVRFGRLRRSHEVGEDCGCQFRTSALILATASSRSGRPMAPAYESESPTSILGSPTSRRGCVATRHHVADLVDPAARAATRLERRPVGGKVEPGATTQAASIGRNRCSSAARESAPTTRSTSLPSRITTSNGIDCAPNLEASPGFASTSIFTTFRCPA